MSSEERKVPELRFKGFNDDWEQRLLKNELALLKDGTHGTHKNSEEGPFLLSAKNIKNGSINITNDDRKISYEEYNKIHKNFNLKKGDILLTIVGTIGETAILQDPKDITFQRSVAYLRPLNLITTFLYNLLNTPHLQIELKRRQVVSAQPGIYLGDLKKINISITNNIKEQNKIGHLFEKIQHLINLHQRKINILIQLKKAILREMFADNMNYTPNLRFYGFNKEWEQRKLGDVANIVGGGTPSTDNPEYWNGKINWYSPIEIGDSIYKSESKKKISELGLKKSSARILPPGTVLYTSRAGIGKTAILDQSGSTNQGFQSIIPLENILDSYFIYSRTEELKIYGERYGSGSTFNEISGKQLAKMPIKIPDIEEQNYIAQFVKYLDSLGIFYQDKLIKFNELKKEYLNKMFI